MDNFRRFPDPSAMMPVMSHLRTRRLDLRLIIGLVIVLVSALAGYALLSAAGQNTAVYVATTSLSPGHVLQKSDLVLTEVQLGQSQQAYLGATELKAGSVVTQAIAAGELVPLSAVGTAQQVTTTTVVVMLDVPLPEDATEGSTVDVWASIAAGQGVFGPPAVIISGAHIAHITEATGLGASSGKTQVEILVPHTKVAALLEAQANGDAISLVPSRTGKSS
ncbi:hypothetical protein M2119_000044 [Aurantimicrobium minutum]|uniref:SAF domain-containing protein n=1 Tax=Aurantimicrobium minutum TaxID=708131 RepID=UPI002477088A|nr:SAF domain-containing protein [Aurantimicrobium minutum]MDH6531807.1 hypothetical protein [Aurantimicrobium minutum]